MNGDDQTNLPAPITPTMMAQPKTREPAHNRLVILRRAARFVANRKVRQLELPWVFHVTRLDRALRIGEISRLEGRIPLAASRR